jgi:hypothetical protein
MRSIVLAVVFLGCGVSGAARADTIPVSMSTEDAALAMLLPASGVPEWTSVENIALMGSLYQLIMTLGGDEAEISALFGPGGALAGYGTPADPSDPSVNSLVVSTSDSVSVVPEPATIGLPAGALVFLLWYATRRVRKIRHHHGPLQRTD